MDSRSPWDAGASAPQLLSKSEIFQEQASVRLHAASKQAEIIRRSGTKRTIHGRCRGAVESVQVVDFQRQAEFWQCARAGITTLAVRFVQMLEKNTLLRATAKRARLGGSCSAPQRLFRMFSHGRDSPRSFLPDGTRVTSLLAVGGHGTSYYRRGLYEIR